VWLSFSLVGRKVNGIMVEEEEDNANAMKKLSVGN
jgi:hypothetical protein